MDASAAHKLVLLLQQFVQASDRYVESTGSLHQTHRTDMNALAAIMRWGPSGKLPTPGDLARELNLSPPATSALLTRLEQNGYITRQRIDKDKRVVRIQLTTKAKEDGRMMFAPLAAGLLEVISSYPPQEITVVTRFVSDAITGINRASENQTAGSGEPTSD